VVRLGVVLVNIARDPPQVPQETKAEPVKRGEPEKGVGITLEENVVQSAPSAEKPGQPRRALRVNARVVCASVSTAGPIAMAVAVAAAAAAAALAGGGALAAARHTHL
jgi:hypothetical protein